MKLETISYLAPEGTHTGTITAAHMHQDFKNGKERENIRFTIALDTPGPDRVTKYMVRVDYWEAQAGKFYEDVYQLLGNQINELVDHEGSIIPDRLSLLEGKRVSLHVAHEKRPGYEHAYRKVTNVKPAVSVPPHRIQFKRAA